MKLESRINYIVFIVLGILFIIVGVALDELNIISEVNTNSQSIGDNLDKWYQFLLPYVGDKDNGLPPPWN